MKYFIIDFDSTFVSCESLDELARLTLENHPDKERIVKEIHAITQKGMEGKLSFDESLKERMNLLTIYKKDIERLVKILKKRITPSIKRNKQFFRTYADRIYIISGGFKDCILPVILDFGVTPDHVLANEFIFNKKGRVTGFDAKNPLSQDGGKVKAIKKLHLTGDVYVVGDGYSDYQLKQLKRVTHFAAFTENVARAVIIEKADSIASTFDEFLHINKLPVSISYPKNRIKAVLLENIDHEAVGLFEKEGFPVEYYEKSPSPDILDEKLKDAYILGIRSRTKITGDLLLSAPHLLAIGAYCIGTDQVDLPFAAQQGVCVFNAPFSNTRSVVELTIGEIIMLLRNIFDKSTKLHQGIWDKSAADSFEIRGKKLGIIGYGNIGSQLSVVAEALGMEVFFYDIVEKLALGNAKKCRSMQELLKKCDIISVHVDGRKENERLIAEKEFRLMKDGVVFLNASRGCVVDVLSLVRHIKQGKVKGAALDVFPKEPKSKDERFISELQGLSNVILTPHIGGSTKEAQKNIAQFVTDKIITYINFGDTRFSVNIPELKVIKMPKTHRLLHLHKNVPGILAKINDILASHKLNVVKQYLKTNEQVGYVVTDVYKKHDEEVIQELKNIPDTIRFRILY